MAKLSARGRKELARVTKTETLTEEQSSVTLERTTVLALMSDGKILQKDSVVFRSGDKHSYGWKVRSKAKAGVTPEMFVSALTNQGYEVAQ